MSTEALQLLQELTLETDSIVNDTFEALHIDVEPLEEEIDPAVMLIELGYE